MLKKALYIIKRMFLPEYRRSYLSRRIKLHRTTHIIFEQLFDLGEYIYIGPNCFINAEGSVQIESGTILAPEVVILSSTHDYTTGHLLPYDIYDQHRPVKIGAGVWIGYRAMICPGVSIGDGAIIAMGAVVTRSVAPGQVVGGNPAKVISNRSSNSYRKQVSKKQFFHKQYWSRKRIRIPAPKRL